MMTVENEATLILMFPIRKGQRMPQKLGNVTFEDARIIFPNFSGKEGRFNQAGDRSFNILLNEDTAELLDADGWNVKALRSREEGDPDQPILPIEVSYRNYPPKVVMITSKGRTTLGEDEIEVLDWADIKQVDLIVRPYEWSVNGKTGVKAYLKTLFVTIDEDFLELKYADLEELPSRSGKVYE